MREEKEKEDEVSFESLEGIYSIKKSTQALTAWAEGAQVLAVFESFRNQYSAQFEACDEYNHSHYNIFRQYERLFADMLEEYIREKIGAIDAARFLRNLTKRHDDNIILQALLSILDFEIFAKQMQRNQEDIKLADDVAGDLGLF